MCVSFSQILNERRCGACMGEEVVVGAAGRQAETFQGFSASSFGPEMVRLSFYGVV